MTAAPRSRCTSATVVTSATSFCSIFRSTTRVCWDALDTRDVDAEPALAWEFGLRVPVLTVDGHVACEGRYDRDKVAAALGL